MQDEKRFGVGVDVGTSTVKVVIGMAEGKNQPVIIGFAEEKNTGMRKGTIINIEQTAQAIDKALAIAEKMSGQKVSSASISINGSHMHGQASRGTVAITGREVSEDDVMRVNQDAALIQLGENREILDITTRSYILSGQEAIKDPIGMSGLRLDADAYVISGLTPHILNLEKVFDLLEVPKTTILPSGLAAAFAILTQEQKESGVVCVDIGGTTTNIVVYEEGELFHLSVLPVGSNAITNDLAIGLRTNLDIAEKVKEDYAVAIWTERKTSGRIKIICEGETHFFETEEVDKIVGARVEEILELINLELHKVDRFAKLPAGAILTGGGSNLNGLTTAAKEILRLNACVGRVPKFGGFGEQLATPSWATALGLMMIDFRDDITVNKPKKKKSFFGFGGKPDKQVRK